MTARCEEYSTARRGICDRPLDEYGNCDRVAEHGDHLADRDLELIEVALESAISATDTGLTANDDVTGLNREYRQALAHVQRARGGGHD